MAPGLWDANLHGGGSRVFEAVCYIEATQRDLGLLPEAVITFKTHTLPSSAPEGPAVPQTAPLSMHGSSVGTREPVEELDRLVSYQIKYAPAIQTRHSTSGCLAERNGNKRLR